MLNPFIDLLIAILQLFLVCIIAWTILVTLISFKIINAYQPFVKKLMLFLDKICLPVLRPVQRILPDMGGFDISPIIVILLVQFLQSALFRYFYNL
jgi:YggT family protein